MNWAACFFTINEHNTPCHCVLVKRVTLEQLNSAEPTDQLSFRALFLGQSWFPACHNTSAQSVLKEPPLPSCHNTNLGLFLSPQNLTPYDKHRVQI